MSTDTLPTVMSMRLVQISTVFEVIADFTPIEDAIFDGEPDIVLDSPFEKGEEYIFGAEMARRAEANISEMGTCAGQLHARKMLEQKDRIPVVWRQFCLVFLGTKWRSLQGRKCIIYLHWDGLRWDYDWRWLDSDFGSCCRLVRVSISVPTP